MVHGVIGVVVLSVCAADPGRFQQLFFFFLKIPLFFLFLRLSVSVPFSFSFPLSLSLSVGEGLFGVSAPGGGVAALSAQAGGALRPSIPLLFPATTFPVSACGTAAKRTFKKEREEKKKPIIALGRDGGYEHWLSTWDQGPS